VAAPKEVGTKRLPVTEHDDVMTIAANGWGGFCTITPEII